MMQHSSFSRAGINRKNCSCSQLGFPLDRRSGFPCDTSVHWRKIISNCSGCSIRPPWICNGWALVHQMMQIYACWSDKHSSYVPPSYAIQISDNLWKQFKFSNNRNLYPTLHNVHFGYYDGPVVKSWNPKIHFLMGKKYFWGYFSYVVLGRKL